MKLSLAMAALLCLGVVSGPAYAVTAGATAPEPAPTATPSADDNSTEADAASTDDGNPYSAIIRANVFKLNDPPKPIAQVDPAILNLPKVNMTGFKRREGEPIRALFATVPKDPKDSPRYFNLTEGEKVDFLEVKHIDPNQKSVDVIIAGTPVTLTVESNSFVQPIAAPKPGAPGGIVARPPAPVAMPAPVPAPVQQPAANNGNNAALYGGGVVVAGGNTGAPAATPAIATVGGGQPQQPNYGGRVVPSPPPPGIVTGGTPIAPSGNTDSALRSIPTRGIRTSNYTPGQTHP